MVKKKKIKRSVTPKKKAKANGLSLRGALDAGKLYDKLRLTMNDLQEKDQNLMDMNEELVTSGEQLQVALRDAGSQKIIADFERKRLETIIEQMGEGVLVIDEDRNIEMINFQACRMLGYERSEDIPEGYKKFFILHLWKEILDNKEQVIKKELKLQRPREASILLTVTRLSGKRDKGGIVAVMRDVTEERKIENMRSDFVANVSHEIRSPMAPMKDALGIVLDESVGPLNDQQKKFLMMIEKNMDRLMRLINDLLDLSKIDAGKFELKLSSVDVCKTMHDTIESLRPNADKKKIDLTLNCQGEPIICMIDQDRFIQVLVNLVTNALKFTPEGGKVFVSASIKENGEKKFLHVFVKDNGPGMRQVDIAQLFDRFKQIAGSHEAKGTGLGLAISKAIVEKHGGEISVTSEFGKGSEFTFWIPVNYE